MTQIRIPALLPAAILILALGSLPAAAQISPADMVSGQVRSSCNSGNTNADLYTVPGDHYLVLTSFSATLNMNAAFNTATTIVTHIEDPSVRWTVTLTQPVGYASGNSPITVNLGNGLVFAPSSVMSVAYFLTGQGSTQVTLSWAGYLVPTSTAAVEEKPAPNQGLAFDIQPNPAGHDTMLSFRLERSEKVVLAVYDVQGRRVRTLVDGTLPAGTQTIRWDGTEDGGAPVVDGVYFARLERASESESARITRLR